MKDEIAVRDGNIVTLSFNKNGSIASDSKRKMKVRGMTSENSTFYENAPISGHVIERGTITDPRGFTIKVDESAIYDTILDGVSIDNKVVTSEVVWVDNKLSKSSCSVKSLKISSLERNDIISTKKNTARKYIFFSKAHVSRKVVISGKESTEEFTAFLLYNLQSKRYCVKKSLSGYVLHSSDDLFDFPDIKIYENEIGIASVSGGMYLKYDSSQMIFDTTDHFGRYQHDCGDNVTVNYGKYSVCDQSATSYFEPIVVEILGEN